MWILRVDIMPGPDSGKDLFNAMIRGGEKAVTAFRSLSGGEWFDEAPEYFLTTHIASSISIFDSSYVLLEVSVDRTRKEAGAFRRGRPAVHERRNGRFDVVIYWSNDNPRGAVEVKSPVWSATENQIQPDIDELCAALKANKDSTFQFCSFLYYASVSEPERKHDNASQRLRDLVSRIEIKAIDRAKEHGVDCLSIPGSIHRGDEVDGGAWCIAALVITHKGRKQSFK